MTYSIKKSDLFTVSVISEFSAGKSTLVNALAIGDDLLPMGSGICTPVPTEILYGEEAKLKVFTSSGEETYTDRTRFKEHFHRWVDSKDIEGFHLQIPNQEIKGLRFIDTPGLNSTDAKHSALTHAIIDNQVSDLVLWMIDMRTDVSGSILETLHKFRGAHNRCYLVGNFIDDVYEHGGQQEIDKAKDNLFKKLVRDTGIFPEPIFFISALDGLEGKMKCDENFLGASKIPELSSFIINHIEEWKIEDKVNTRKTQEAYEREQVEKLKTYLEVLIKKIHGNLFEIKSELKEKIEISKNNIKKGHAAAVDDLKGDYFSEIFKSILAQEIDLRVEKQASLRSPTTHPFEFLWKFLEEDLPYINALLTVHIHYCINCYSNKLSEVIKNNVEGTGNYLLEKLKKINVEKDVNEINGILDEIRSSKPSGHLLDYINNVDSIIKKLSEIGIYKLEAININGASVPPLSANSVDDAVTNAVNAILASIGAITATIAVFFVQTTVTYLIIISISVWNPIGIIILVVGSILAWTGVAKIKSLGERMAVDMKRKYLGFENEDGVLKKMWEGGVSNIENIEIGWSGRVLMSTTEHGEKLLQYIDNPSNSSSRFNKSHVKFASNRLGIKIDDRTIHDILDIMNNNNDNVSFSSTTPSLKEERLKDLDRIFSGHIDSRMQTKQQNGQPMKGLGAVFDDFIAVIDHLDHQIASFVKN